MTTFETGKTYGNDFTFKVLKRTAKTITIECNAWGENRVKVRNFNSEVESIHFKAWVIDASELFDKEIATRLAYERSYN